MEESKKQRYKPDATDIRRRQLGAISAILNGKRRRGAEEEAVAKPGSSTADGKESSGRRITGSAGESDEEDARSHKRHRGREDEGGKPRSKRHHDRSRSRSPRDRERAHRRRSPTERDRRRSRSPRSKPRAEERGKGSRSKDDLMTRILNHRRERRREEPAEGGRKPRDSTAGKRDSRGGQASSRRGSGRLVPRDDMVDVEDERPNDDSDPLEDLIGPAPPPLRSRGRGTAAGPSAMDGRFSANYDPKSDVTPDLDEAGDWEEAVETFRDRQKWKQQGADRLRTAGFTEDQIKKWEKGDDKSEEDVRWSKPGEGREWDRGKVAE